MSFTREANDLKFLSVTSLAPSDGFHLNTLKTLFRLSRILLDL